MAIVQRNSIDSSTQLIERPTADLWQPHHLVDVGNEVTVGITTDDGCYVVLAQTSTGQWRPTTHIPTEAAKMLAHLVT